MALSGVEGEKIFMPKIDIGSPKSTGFLPYELLAVGNKVFVLHGRLRIALSFWYPYPLTQKGRAAQLGQIVGWCTSFRACPTTTGRLYR